MPAEKLWLWSMPRPRPTHWHKIVCSALRSASATTRAPLHVRQLSWTTATRGRVVPAPKSSTTHGDKIQGLLRSPDKDGDRYIEIWDPRLTANCYRDAVLWQKLSEALRRQGALAVSTAHRRRVGGCTTTTTLTFGSRQMSKCVLEQETKRSDPGIPVPQPSAMILRLHVLRSADGITRRAPRAVLPPRATAHGYSSRPAKPSSTSSSTAVARNGRSLSGNQQSAIEKVIEEIGKRRFFLTRPATPKLHAIAGSSWARLMVKLASKSREILRLPPPT